jgi:DNA modification methylase
VNWQIICGESLEVMRGMESDSIDALCCDPPAGINFMNKAFDSDRGGRNAWIAWLSEIMREALRVCRPGAHGFVWALPRTSHWTMLALEDAGWEIREVCHHIFGSGFPKSKSMRDIGRPELGTALKPAVENWILVRKPLSEKNVASQVLATGTGAINVDGCRVGMDQISQHGDRADSFGFTSPEEKGRTWTGRWPPNLLLSHSPGCVRTGEVRRVKGSGWARTGSKASENRAMSGPNYDRAPKPDAFADPDGTEAVEAYECVEDCPVRVMDEQSGQSGQSKSTDRAAYVGNGYGTGDGTTYLSQKPQGKGHNDSGGASRFFPNFENQPPFRYQAKASRRERNAGLPDGQPSTHPTVKPIELMRWLVRLVTPPGGTVLDPFAGTGSTGCAAVQEGFNFIGIEAEPEYAEIARRRIAHWQGESPERLEKPKKNTPLEPSEPLDTLF